MANYQRVARDDQNTSVIAEFDCDNCGTHLLVTLHSEPDCTRCGARYNRSAQRLRDDWDGNPSTWDENIGDLEGFEIQHANDD